MAADFGNYMGYEPMQDEESLYGQQAYGRGRFDNGPRRPAPVPLDIPPSRAPEVSEPRGGDPVPRQRYPGGEQRPGPVSYGGDMGTSAPPNPNPPDMPPSNRGVTSYLGAPVGTYGARPAYRGASEMGSFGRMRAAGQSAGWGGSGMGAASAGPSDAMNNFGRIRQRTTGWGGGSFGAAAGSSMGAAPAQNAAQQGQEQKQQLQGLNTQRQKPQGF